MTKVVIVTGAGSGIGKAVAFAVAEGGYAVVLAGRNSDCLPKVKEELSRQSLDKQHLAVPADATDPASVKALFNAVRDVFGWLDLLFNNAGVFVPGASIEDVPLGQWNTLLGTNLIGVYLCTQEAFRIMKEQNPRGGRIINNGSISAHVPRPGSAAYTA